MLTKFPKNYTQDPCLEPYDPQKAEILRDSQQNAVIQMGRKSVIRLATLPGSTKVRGGTIGMNEGQTRPEDISSGIFENVLDLGHDSLVKLSNEGILIGPNVGISGGGWAMGHQGLFGYADASLRFRLYLEQTESIEPGTCIIGDLENDQYAMWDQANAQFIVKGTFYATAGVIGGWSISSDALYKDDGVNSAGMVPSDYAFYAGDTFVNRASAPFRVYKDGSAVISNANVTGTIVASSGQIGGWIISGRQLVSYNNAIELDPAQATLSGTADATETKKLHDANGEFDKGLVGSIVHNTTDDTYAQILGYVDSGELDLSADIFTSGENYTIDVSAHIKIYSEGSANSNDFAQITGAEDLNDANIGVPRLDIYRDIIETGGNVRTQYGKILWFNTKYQIDSYYPCPFVQIWTKDGKEYNEEFGTSLPEKDGISIWALFMKSAGDGSSVVKSAIQFYGYTAQSGSTGEIGLTGQVIAPQTTMRLGDYNAKFSQLYLDQLVSDPVGDYLAEGVIFARDNHHLYFYNGTSLIQLDDAASGIYLPLAGGTMSGEIAMGNNLITGLATPIFNTDAATKGYIDSALTSFLALSGGTMTGEIAMSNHKITGLATPVASDDAATKDYIDNAAFLAEVKDDSTPQLGGNLDCQSLYKIYNMTTPTDSADGTTKGYVDDLVSDYLSLAGGTMTGEIAMGNHKITGLATPVVDTDASTKGYIDSALTSYLGLSGGTMTGNINMGGNSITNANTATFSQAITVGTPTNVGHAATKGYVDDNFLSTAGGTMDAGIDMDSNPIIDVSYVLFDAIATPGTPINGMLFNWSGDGHLYYRFDDDWVGPIDGSFLPLSGGVMNGNINMDRNNISNITDCEIEGLAYIGTLQVGASGTGNLINANLSMTNHNITNLAVPVDATCAATKGYVDDNFLSLAGGSMDGNRITDVLPVLESLASDPGTPANGLMYYNTTNDEVRVYLGGNWWRFDLTLII